MKKKIILCIIIIIALVLLIPIPFTLKDGGTIEFRALLYTITKYHMLNLESETVYTDGFGIKILGMEVFNSLERNEDNIENVQEDVPDAVMIRGRVYYSTGEKSTITGRCGNMDGYIISTVEKGKTPTKDDESNFGTEYGYQRVDYNTIEVFMDNDFIVFKGEETPFEIIFNPRNDLYTKTIIEVGETDRYSYSIYSYGGDVIIKIDNKEYDFRDALLNNKITMEEIIDKANKDAFQDKTIKVDSLNDGGTNMYYYNNYAIIKYNRLDGNRDVYIGIPTMIDPAYTRF